MTLLLTRKSCAVAPGYTDQQQIDCLPWRWLLSLPAAPQGCTDYATLIRSMPYLWTYPWITCNAQPLVLARGEPVSDTALAGTYSSTSYRRSAVE
jgi:hypothetical protein